MYGHGHLDLSLPPGAGLTKWKGEKQSLLERLPLDYDDTTLHTIEQIDVLFEIPHMTRFVCLQTASKIASFNSTLFFTTKTETDIYREGIFPSLSFSFSRILLL